MSKKKEVSSQTLEQLKKELKSGKIRPLYVSASPDEGDYYQLINLLKKNMFKDVKTGVFESFYKFYGDEFILDDFENEYNSMSLFAEKRLFCIKDLYKYKGTDYARMKNKLVDIIKNPPDETVLILFNKTGFDVEGNKKYKSRIESLGKLGKYGVFVKMVLLNRRNAGRWIEKFLSMKDKRISTDAVSRIIELIGVDKFRFKQELDKLIFYVDEKKYIDLDDVNTIIQGYNEINFFKLAELVFKKEKNNSLKLYKQLVNENISPILIFSWITTQVRMLFYVKKETGGSYYGGNNYELVKKLKVYSYRFTVKNIYYYLKLSSEIKLNRLKKLLKILAELDYQLKSNAPDIANAVTETAIVKMCER